MRRLICILIVCLLGSCNNDGSSTEIKFDSIGRELDTLGKKIDTTLDKAWDSTKEKAKDLKNMIEIKLDKRNDSIQIKDSLSKN